jgi:hypothetical protein
MKEGGMGTALEGVRETCKTLIPNPKGKPPLDRERHVLESSIQSKVKGTGYDYVNYIHSNNAVFWDVTPCRSCGCFGGIYRLHLQGIKIRERGTSVSRLLQTEILCTQSTQGRV